MTCRCDTPDMKAPKRAGKIIEEMILLSTRFVMAALLLSGTATPALPQTAPTAASDIPSGVEPDETRKNYEMRTVKIPMRDGVGLNTLVFVPRGTRHAPIIFSRTPYGAAKALGGGSSNDYRSSLPVSFAALAEAGYIIVVQDVRGRYSSEGDYVVARPLAGALNPTGVDHSTDAWDSIDWLVTNVAETNGRVGTIGVSYGGFTTLMSLVNPHPALKAAVPINPLVDGWMGDDWFHNGAFRQGYLDWIYAMSADKSSRYTLELSRHDTYESWLEAGSAGEMASRWGMDRFPMFQKLVAHQAYDDYWQQQALDRILAKQPLKVSTLHVHSLWDQEDIYGAPAAYQAMEARDRENNGNYLVIGPWRHGQSVAADGSKLGALDFDGNSSAWFHRKILIPFLDQHLKDGGQPAAIAPVTAFETGANAWQKYERWPMSCPGDCATNPRPIYLWAKGEMGWEPPVGAGGFAEYISDPARPVTYRQRPLLATYDRLSTWGQWLVDDQRFAEARPDVVTFVSDVLSEDLRLAGDPVARFFASTSGTDSDWVVKLIDVYPDVYPADPAMAGYELPVSMDIFRGRYRKSPSKATPLAANEVLPYEIKLPPVSHKFLKGHRVMVQIQSSWFPLYDRNPQTFVPNIFLAKKADYRKAVQRIYTSPQYPSRIDLPVIP